MPPVVGSIHTVFLICAEPSIAYQLQPIGVPMLPRET